MLAAYPILRTRSTDVVVDLIDRVVGVSLRRIGCEGPIEAAINGLWLRRVSFSETGYGFAASLAPKGEVSTYILSLPQRGTIAVAENDRRWNVRPGMGTMLSPGARLTFDYPQHMRRVVMRIDADALAQQFALVSGKPAPAPLRFDPVFGPDGPAFAALRRQILVTISRIDSGWLGPAPDATSEEVESSLLTALLYALPHDRWADLTAPSPAPNPGSVRRVIEYIHANADRAVTLDDLVAVSGVAGRTLFKHFRAFKGVGPMGYLRCVRLARVRDALAAAGPHDTVTEIATRWSFHELGRFAVNYRRLYGETPSATLRRRQRLA